ncbi:hypothetical protein KAM380_079540 [Aeromonas caviae]|nr:hypothetical protein KAM380_079540 [Aeromonas caviae]
MASLLDEQVSLFIQALMGTLRLWGYGLVHKSYLLSEKPQKTATQSLYREFEAPVGIRARY